VTVAVFHPSARGELEASIDFYEAQLEGLGARFLAAVEETIERIAQLPGAGSPLEARLRKRLVPGFPFSVVYRTWQDQVFIVAVAHQHRRPDYWQRRRRPG
jgi:plasmid stabilization system protein ParE